MWVLGIQPGSFSTATVLLSTAPTIQAKLYIRFMHHSVILTSFQPFKNVKTLLTCGPYHFRYTRISGEECGLLKLLVIYFLVKATQYVNSQADGIKC